MPEGCPTMSKKINAFIVKKSLVKGVLARLKHTLWLVNFEKQLIFLSLKQKIPNSFISQIYLPKSCHAKKLI